MKKRKQLITLVLIGFSCSLHAQVSAVGKKPVLKTSFVQETMVLKQASDMIVKASIPEIKKPKMVALDLKEQLNQLKEQCPLLLAEKATLELDGERANNNTVKLQWETTNGWNNSSFAVQRSLGDTLHFETVNHVWAKTIAGLKDTYRQPDDNNYNKISYYRLRLTLKNGETLFSNIAKVEGYETESLKLFPNPASGKVLVTVDTETDGLATIFLYDAAGVQISRQNNFMIVAGRNTKEVNIGGLANGFYTVKVLMPDNTQRIARVVKQ